MLRLLLIGTACCGLAGCIIVPWPPAPFGDLQSAREACNEQYPRLVGNFLPHAICVNDAVDTYALPVARYPDLVQLQEAVRSTISAKIDRRQLSIPAGEHRMAEADRLIDEAEHERDRGNSVAADRHILAVRAMLRH